MAPHEVQTSGKQLVISLHGELVPMLSLRKILQQPKAAAPRSIPLEATGSRTRTGPLSGRERAGPW